jgi:hypothetical protein
VGSQRVEFDHRKNERTQERESERASSGDELIISLKVFVTKEAVETRTHRVQVLGVVGERGFEDMPRFGIVSGVAVLYCVACHTQLGDDFPCARNAPSLGCALLFFY